MFSKISQKGTISISWLFYLVIVFEIIYMITPFLAFSYYSSYGPALNFLNTWSGTAWLTGFFLPHICETSSSFLNPKILYSIGAGMFFVGLFLFLLGAGQIYMAKLLRKGAVTGGLYKYVRNPQYTAFSIMGLGVLLIWPRTIILVMYMTMLFAYFYLARREERECQKKFGAEFEAYVRKTPMFIPIEFPIKIQLPFIASRGWKRSIALLSMYAITTVAVIILAHGLKRYSIRKLSVHYTKDSATISTMRLDSNIIKKALNLALSVPDVNESLHGIGYGSGAILVNYLVPLKWILADLPLEEIPEGTHGHVTPMPENPFEFKLLFTKAKTHAKKFSSGADIIENTYGRIPIIVVKLDINTNRIMAIEKPPTHVVWGDIPTPLF